MKKEYKRYIIEVFYFFRYLQIMKQEELLQHQRLMKILQNVEDMRIVGQEMHLL